MDLDEAARQADLISGRVPETEPEPEPIEDDRPLDQIPKDEQVEAEQLKIKKVEQDSLNEVPSANDSLAISGAEVIEIKMDVGEQIMGALPGKGMWDVQNNRAVFATGGKAFDGIDVANSSGAIEAFVLDTLGEAHRSIYSRAVTAPLDPAYRLQENAVGTTNPILAEMQKQGVIAEDYVDGDLGAVETSSLVGITSVM